MTQEQATVFVVDDDASVRKSLSRLFRSAGLKVEVFSSADEFLAREPSADHGCILLDIRMPGLSGLDLYRQLRKRDYSIPVVFLTGHGDIPTGVQAIKDGAVDFLTKPVSDTELLETTRVALEKDAVERAKHIKATDITERVRSLTGREREVLTYVITGMLNKQIAAALGISEKTVKVHRGRVTQKLGASSVAELVRLAETAGLQPADLPDS